MTVKRSGGTRWNHMLGGATGGLDGEIGKWPEVKERMGIALDLAVAATSTHSQRDQLVSFADCLAQVSGSLGKIGQDVALMAQDEIGEIALAGGGKSSVIPYKNNPIAAEVLVALARFNAVQISAMHHAMVHEQERSGAAWTLEWMVLPQICVAAAASLATAKRLFSKTRGVGQSLTIRANAGADQTEWSPGAESRVRCDIDLRTIWKHKPCRTRVSLGH